MNSPIEEHTDEDFDYMIHLECVNDIKVDKTEFAKALEVTLSSDRGKERALATIIRDDEKVEKRALLQRGFYIYMECCLNMISACRENGIDIPILYAPRFSRKKDKIWLQNFITDMMLESIEIENNFPLLEVVKIKLLQTGKALSKD